MSQGQKKVLYGSLFMKEIDNRIEGLALKAKAPGPYGKEHVFEEFLYDLVPPDFFEKRVSITIRVLKQPEET